MNKVMEKHKQIMERMLNNRPAPPPKTREMLIREKISERYSIADEIALINNYNLYVNNNELVQYKEEYDEYNAFRMQVKAEVDNESN